MITLLATIAGYLLLGIGVYLLDTQIIQWFAIKPSDENQKPKGIIAVERKIQWRIISAIIIVLLFAWLGWGEDDKFSLTFIFHLGIQFVSIIVGFYLAPYAMKFMPGFIKKAMKYVDDVDSGKRKPMEDLKGVANQVKKVVEKEDAKTDTHSTTPKPDAKPAEEKKDTRSFEEKIKDVTD